MGNLAIRGVLLAAILSTILFAAHTAAIAEARNSSHKPFNAIVVYNSTFLRVYKLPQGYIIASWERPGIERHFTGAFRPAAFAWTNSSVLLVYWTGGNVYFPGDNLTVNILALGPEGGVEGISATVKLQGYGAYDLYMEKNVTTGDQGFARAVFTIPQNFTGHIHVEVAANANVTRTSLEAWVRVPENIVVMPIWGLRRVDGNATEVVLVSMDKYGRPFNGTLKISIGGTMLVGGNVSSPVFRDIPPEYHNVSFTGGVARLDVNTSSLADAAAAIIVMHLEPSYQWIGDVRIFRDTYVAVKPLIRWWVEFNTSGVLTIPFVAAYANGTAFTGQVRACMHVRYVNGTEEWYDRLLLNFTRGIAFLQINVSNVDSLYVHDCWPFSVASDGSKLYMTAGFWTSFHRAKERHGAPGTAARHLSLDLYVSRRAPNGVGMLEAYVSYDGKPLPNATVYFYLPWPEAPVYRVVTDSNGVAVLNASILLGYINESRGLLGLDRSMRMVEGQVLFAASVSYGGESALDTTAASLPDLLGRPRFEAGITSVGELYNATVCFTDERYSSNLPHIRFAAFAWAHRYMLGWPPVVYEADAAPIAPGECRSFTLHPPPKWGYTGVGLSGPTWGEWISRRTGLYPYQIRVVKFGRADVWGGCWVTGTIAYTGEDIDVNGTVTFNTTGVSGAEVYASLAYFADSIATANTTTGRDGAYSLVLPGSPVETTVEGGVVGFTSNGMVALCDSDLVGVDGEIVTPPTQTTPPPPTTTTTPKASPVVVVGGTLSVPAAREMDHGMAVVIAAGFAVVVAAFIMAAMRRTKG